MLQSVKIQKRQSEIRQSLAELVNKETPTDDETRSMEQLDSEYRSNEVRYRAALTSEDAERREAGAELETREDKELSALIGQYELRQALLFLDEGQALSGATAELVQEMRGQSGFRGVPVPLMALEQRAGESVASGLHVPVEDRSIIDRLFPNSVAAAMGTQLVNIGSGQVEYPVVTSSVTAGWASTETGSVSGPTQYTTADRSLKPNQNLGITMKITRRSLKQTAGIEDAIRRDMRSTIGAELDKALFLGTGASGQPLGVVTGQSTYGYTTTAVAAAATWAVFRAEVVGFLTGNAATGAGDVKVLMRPEVWDKLDGTVFDAGSGKTELDRLHANIPAGNVKLTSNALAAPTGAPTASTVLLTTTAGGISPIFLGIWGGIDLIRDPYSDAASGGLRITALLTADVNVSRTSQIRSMTGVQD